jgi:hypothetical protein
MARNRDAMDGRVDDGDTRSIVNDLVIRCTMVTNNLVSGIEKK